MRGLIAFYDGLSELDTAVELGQQLLALGRRTGDAGTQVAAYSGLGVSRFWKGSYARCMEDFDAALALYDPAQHAQLAFTFGMDQAVEAYGFSGWALWAMGKPGHAETRIRDGIAHAVALEHRYSQAYALMLAAVAYLHMGRFGDSTSRAEQCIALCDRHGFPLFRGVCKAVMATVLACERGQDALEQALAGLGEASGAGQRSGTPGMLWMLATIQHALDRDVEALGFLDAALAESRESSQPFFDAPLLCMKGELLLPEDRAAGQEALERALEVARAQGAGMYVLKAALPLSRLWRADGSGEQARAVLATALAGIEGGEALSEVRAARAGLAG